MIETGMRCSIGKMIHTLREKAGISQKRLAEGILSIAELSRVENGEKEEDMFVLEALLQRLGKSADEFEMLTSSEEYRILLIKELITENLLDHNLQMVAQLLYEYHENSMEQKSIHEQYLCQMRAINYYLADGNRENCIQNLLQVMAITKPDSKWEAENWEELYFCTQEIQILLMIGCLWMEKEEIEKAFLLLNKVWKYIGQNVTDEAEQKKLYPKCAWLLGELYCGQGRIEKAYLICEEGKACLVENGSLIVMDKLLSLEEICLKKFGRKLERKIIQNQLRAVEDLYEMANLKLPEEKILYMLLTSGHNEILISNEMVRELRTSCGLSQEKLSEGICSRETLTRIVGGKRSPNRKNLQALLRKMGEGREKYHGYIVTDDYEMYEKVRLYHKNVFQKKSESATKLFNEIVMKLDVSNPINRQFIEYNYLSVKIQSKKIGYEQAIEELENILRYTMINYQGGIYRVPYREEFVILNRIAICKRHNGDLQGAEQLYRQLLKIYEESIVEKNHHDIPMFLLYINYTGLLEGMGQIAEAERIGKRGLQLMLKVQRGDVAAKLLGNISCVYEKKNTEKDREKCKICMRQSYWLDDLYHLETDSLVVKKAYMKKFAKELV